MTAMITEAQLKAWLNIDDSSDDALISLLTSSASQMVRTYCGRSFEVDTSQTASARYFNRINDSLIYIDDCYEITSVYTDNNDDGTYSQAWGATDWQALPVGGIGPTGLSGWPYDQITAVSAFEFPITARPAAKVTAKWGWSALPDDVKNATLMVGAELYKARSGGGDVFTADMSFTPIRRNMLVRDLLQPYRGRRAHDYRFVVA